MATTGTPTEGSGTPISTDPETVSRDPFDTVMTFVPPSPQLPPPSPVKLNDTHNLGPVDPRSYSAVTGLRSIENFAIESEAGKGAYGTVVKAREKGPDGQPVGVSAFETMRCGRHERPVEELTPLTSSSDSRSS